MILSFKTQFVEPILAGTKIHTLRLDPNDRWCGGRSIQFATGVRTKNYSCFKVGGCASVQRVLISLEANGIVWVVVDGYALPRGDIDLFIKNDGFKDEKDFINWFFPKGENSETDLFLKLIHWTDFKY